MSMDSYDRQILRAMEWEKVKGMLNSIMASYSDSDGNFDAMQKAVDDFTELVSDNELWV